MLALRPRSMVLVLAAGSVLSAAAPALAQPFEKAYGSGPIQFEQFNAVTSLVHRPSGAVLGDGAISVGDLPPATGSTFNPPDWLVVRTAADGSLLWKKRVVVSDSSYAGATSACTLSDGSIVIAGSRATSFSTDRLGVVRMDASGNVLWARDFATGSTNFSSRAASVVVQNDGNLAVVFQRDDAVGIVRLSPAGALVSARSYALPGGGGSLSASDVVHAASSVVICGSTLDLTTFNTRAFVARLGDAPGSFSAAAYRIVDLDGVHVPYTAAVAIEQLPGGDLALAGPGDVYPDHLPEDEVFPTAGVLVVRATPALVPVWRSLITNSSASQGLQPASASLRTQNDGVQDIIALAGQFPFGDGGSYLWLARWQGNGTFLNRREYQNTGFNSFPGGLAVATGVPGWVIAGYLSRFDGPGALIVRPDLAGVTGCETTPEDEVVIRPWEWLPLTLEETALSTSLSVWTPAVIELDFVAENLCSGGGPVGCNLADITEVGGTEEFPGNPDSQLTVDDLILFVNLFSAATGCPGTAPCNRADVTGIGGSGAAPDGELTVDDLIEFVNAFSTGC